MVQWLAVSPYYKKVLGSNFFWELMCLPQNDNMLVRLTKSVVDVELRVKNCLSLVAVSAVPCMPCYDSWISG